MIVIVRRQLDNLLGEQMRRALFPCLHAIAKLTVELANQHILFFLRQAYPSSRVHILIQRHILAAVFLGSESVGGIAVCIVQNISRFLVIGGGEHIRVPVPDCAQVLGISGQGNAGIGQIQIQSFIRGNRKPVAAHLRDIPECVISFRMNGRTVCLFVRRGLQFVSVCRRVHQVLNAVRLVCNNIASRCQAGIEDRIALMQFQEIIICVRRISLIGANALFHIIAFDIEVESFLIAELVPALGVSLDQDLRRTVREGQASVHAPVVPGVSAVDLEILSSVGNCESSGGLGPYNIPVRKIVGCEPHRIVLQFLVVHGNQEACTGNLADNSPPLFHVSGNHVRAAVIRIDGQLPVRAVLFIQNVVRGQRFRINPDCLYRLVLRVLSDKANLVLICFLIQAGKLGGISRLVFDLPVALPDVQILNRSGQRNQILNGDRFLSFVNDRFAEFLRIGNPGLFESLQEGCRLFDDDLVIVGLHLSGNILSHLHLGALQIMMNRIGIFVGLRLNQCEPLGSGTVSVGNEARILITCIYAIQIHTEGIPAGQPDLAAGRFHINSRRTGG